MAFLGLPFLGFILFGPFASTLFLLPPPPRCLSNQPSSSSSTRMSSLQRGFGLHDAVKGEMERTEMLKEHSGPGGRGPHKGHQGSPRAHYVCQRPLRQPSARFRHPQECPRRLPLQSVCLGEADPRRPQATTLNDLVVEGKKGLCAFSGTNLESLLHDNNIKNVAIGGFLTNCCVESTMRTAYERLFNVCTLTDAPSWTASSVRSSRWRRKRSGGTSRRLWTSRGRIGEQDLRRKFIPFGSSILYI